MSLARRFSAPLRHRHRRPPSLANPAFKPNLRRGCRHRHPHRHPCSWLNQARFGAFAAFFLWVPSRELAAFSLRPGTPKGGRRGRESQARAGAGAVAHHHRASTTPGDRERLTSSASSAPYRAPTVPPLTRANPALKPAQPRLPRPTAPLLPPSERAQAQYSSQICASGVAQTRPLGADESFCAHKLTPRMGLRRGPTGGPISKPGSGHRVSPVTAIGARSDEVRRLAVRLPEDTHRRP